MKRTALFIASLLLVGSLSGLAVYGATSISQADPGSLDYSDIAYTFDGYTVTQGDPTVIDTSATVPFTVTGNGYNGTFNVVMPFSNSGVFTFVPANISGDVDVVMIPPIVRIDSNNYVLGGIIAPTSNISAEVHKLYILADERNIEVPANCFRYIPTLTDLTITGHVTLLNNVLRGQTNLKSVYVDELVDSSAATQLYSTNNISNVNEVTFSLKIASTTTTVKKLVTSGNVPSGGLILKLLPGSVKAKSIDFDGVKEVQVDSSVWFDGITVNDLTNEPQNNADSLQITPYGGSSATMYNVVIDNGQTGVSLDKSEASEGEIVTITATPDEGKQVGSVTVLAEGNESVVAVVDSQDSNKYTFEMPASDVIISVAFEDIPAVAITPASDTVARGASTTVTVSAIGLKDVSSLYITITYDEAKFNLKSPAYSNLLSSAPLKGDLTKGEYVVAFATPQNLSGDLLTFQLEAKDDVAVGAYTIGCTVEINGTVSGNSNAPEHTYTDTSALAIGNVLGDLDSDGDVDEDDAVHLLLYTFRASTYPIPEGQNVDYNNDGVINSDDAIYLKNYVVNPTQYPLGGA